jgi:hypothetical protein
MERTTVNTGTFGKAGRMGKGDSGWMRMETAMLQDAPPNGGAPLARVVGPYQRVSEMQAKLHRWAAADPGRRFDDLFNFVHDPATLIVAFDRVSFPRLTGDFQTRFDLADRGRKSGACPQEVSG